jgi:hypothetical protein
MKKAMSLIAQLKSIIMSKYQQEYVNGTFNLGSDHRYIYCEQDNCYNYSFDGLATVMKYIGITDYSDTIDCCFMDEKWIQVKNKNCCPKCHLDADSFKSFMKIIIFMKKKTT